MRVPDDVISEVERQLAVILEVGEPATGVWGETAGFRTDRDSWVRVSFRSRRSIQPQSWIGPEAASATLSDAVPVPRWFRSVSWLDDDRDRVWRADEIEFSNSPTILNRTAVLTTDPELSAEWWGQLSGSLVALASHRTHRMSGRQELITRRICQTFGGKIDTTVTEWAVAHGDLHWGNITAPELMFLDWGDWGLAPRGNDAAGLWACALAVPRIADQVFNLFRQDLMSRSGMIARLWVLSNIVRNSHRPDTAVIADKAANAAKILIKELH